MSATIHVSREAKGQADRLRSYVVLIDDQERGKLKRGEEIDIEVAPGSHRVQIKVEMGRSPEVEVKLAEGERANMVCGQNINVLTQTFYLMFRRSKYATLKRVD